MKKGFDRLRGVAAASAMGLGLLGGAGSVRAVSVTTKTEVWFGTFTSVTTSSTVVSAPTKWMGIGNQTNVMSNQSISTTGGFALTAGQSAWGIDDVQVLFERNAFDTAMFLAVGNNLFINPDNTVDLTDKNLTTDTIVDIVTGVDAQIQYYFNPARPSVLRALYSVTNTTGADIATSILVMGNVWSDATTTVQGTSDGDLIVETSDTWVATNNNTTIGGDGGSLPDSVISSHGNGAPVVPVVAMALGSPTGGSGKTDNFGYRYDVTIPVGATRRVVVFSEHKNTIAAALAAAPDFETLAAANTAGLLTGLSATQLSEIVNYGADADLDGALDSADAFPNDATETVDTDSDGVGDNTDAFPNDATETVDTDNDGIGDNSDTDAFSFTDQTAVALSTLTTSNTITLSGTNATLAITVSGGEYSINGGAYTASAGTVNNADSVTVRQTSSAGFGATTNAVLTIGAMSDTFSVTTLAGNHAPSISGTPLTTTAEDASYSFTPTADDADTGDTLTFSIINKPDWASFNTSDGTLSGTPANADVGTTTGIVIRVSDGTATTSLPSFDLTVTNTADIHDINSHGVNGLVLLVNESRTVTFSVDDPSISDSVIYSVSTSTLGTAAFVGNELIFTALLEGSEQLTITTIDRLGDAGSMVLPITVNAASSTDSNGDGMTDEQAADNGLDSNIESGDTDGDGTPDSEEIGDPSNPNDSDGDGIIDALEVGDGAANVASLHFVVPSTTATELGLEDYSAKEVQLTVPAGATIQAHTNGSTGLPLSTEKGIGLSDSNYDYSAGLYEFSVTPPAGQSSVTVTIQLPLDVAIPADAIVRKLDINDVWRTVDNAVIDRDTKTLTFTLHDNDGVFDLNPAVGVIRDPVGIATPVSNVSSGNSGGGGAIGYFMSLFMLLRGLFVFRGTTKKTK